MHAEFAKVKQIKEIRFKTNDKKKLSIVFILEDNLMSEGQGNNLHVHKSR